MLFSRMHDHAFYTMQCVLNMATAQGVKAHICLSLCSAVDASMLCSACVCDVNIMSSDLSHDRGLLPGTGKQMTKQSGICMHAPYLRVIRMLLEHSVRVSHHRTPEASTETWYCYNESIAFGSSVVIVSVKGALHLVVVLSL